MSNWQPIKTAPKDGTVIDVWIGGEFAGRVADVIFSEHPHQCASQYCDSCPDEEEVAKQWRDTVFFAPLLGEPTHWKPLPEGPTVETTVRPSFEGSLCEHVPAGYACEICNHDGVAQ